jgi:hypothetical protein
MGKAILENQKLLLMAKNQWKRKLSQVEEISFALGFDTGWVYKKCSLKFLSSNRRSSVVSWSLDSEIFKSLRAFHDGLKISQQKYNTEIMSFLKTFTEIIVFAMKT